MCLLQKKKKNILIYRSRNVIQLIQCDLSLGYRCRNTTFTLEDLRWKASVVHLLLMMTATLLLVIYLFIFPTSTCHALFWTSINNGFHCERFWSSLCSKVRQWKMKPVRRSKLIRLSSSIKNGRSLQKTAGRYMSRINQNDNCSGRTVGTSNIQKMDIFLLLLLLRFFI